MSLGSLLGQYSGIRADLNANDHRARDLNGRYREIEKSIARQVELDFRHFVDNVCVLPEGRPTNWDVQYSGVIGKAFITITHIDGKSYENDEFVRKLPLPPHMKKLEAFGEGYPVGVSFELLNHATLDMSLDEMK